MSHIRIIAQTDRIVIDPSDETVSIERGGPIGPAGPPGQGGQSISYEHTQALSATSWVINHNLGYRPSVTVIESGSGDQLVGRIIFHSAKQLEIQFNQSRGGSAFLS